MCQAVVGPTPCHAPMPLPKEPSALEGYERSYETTVRHQEAGFIAKTKKGGDFRPKAGNPGASFISCA